MCSTDLIHFFCYHSTQASAIDTHLCYLSTQACARVPVKVQPYSKYGQSTELVSQEALCLEVLDRELSPENYKDYFRTLLYLEEHERQRFLTKE